MNVKVTFKYGPKGQKPSVTATQVLSAMPGKTESVVLAELRRRHPTYGEILIIKIE